MMLRYLNLSIEKAVQDIYPSNEYYALHQATLTVEAGESMAELPDGCIFVSDYRDPYLSVDLRPRIDNVGHLTLEEHYYIEGDYLVLTSPVANETTITVYVKVLPPTILMLTADIELPRFWRGLIMELVLFYARRRDENVQPEQVPLIVDLTRTVRKTINRQSGSARNFQVRYNIIR